uniref:Uncharacterized protein n=1 Tax=viral metagenome TaxID=1070528 RepID=A0A6C0H8L2_9ZZZZ
MSSLLFSSDIIDATDLPVQLNYDIKELLKYISDNNKKYLLLSLLKINKIIILYHECSRHSIYIPESITTNPEKGEEINKDINFLINLFIRSYHNINIYPKNLNIIHYIIFNKINIYEVLFLAIRIYYMDICEIILCEPWSRVYINKYYLFDCRNVECNTLIHNICNSYDDTNINMLFNHNYTDLLFNGPNIINEISFLTDKINNLQIQTDHYYKLTEEYNFSKNKEISIINDIVNQLNFHHNENNINKNQINILINKINNLQIQTEYYYKLTEDIKLIKNKLINDVKQLNIQYNENNNKLMNKIIILTKQNKVITKQNYYYYNKIDTLENNTYILNKLLSSIIIIYFLIIFIISTFLFFTYNNIIDKQSSQFI